MLNGLNFILFIANIKCLNAQKSRKNSLVIKKEVNRWSFKLWCVRKAEPQNSIWIKHCKILSWQDFSKCHILKTNTSQTNSVSGFETLGKEILLTFFDCNIAGEHGPNSNVDKLTTFPPLIRECEVLKLATDPAGSPTRATLFRFKEEGSSNVTATFSGPFFVFNVKRFSICFVWQGIVTEELASHSWNIFSYFESNNLATKNYICLSTTVNFRFVTSRDRQEGTRISVVPLYRGSALKKPK